MNIDMYRKHFDVQKKHWWFVTKKAIVSDMIDRFFGRPATCKILDIGCGSGLMLNALEKVGKVYGMDMSDEAISFSQELVNGVIEKGFLPDQIPYQENSFDLITALDVIEHIDRDGDSLRAIRSLLVPNGKAVITVPAYQFLWSAFDERNEHKRRYTRAELKSKLEQAGFVIEKITYYNTLLFPIVFMVRKLDNLLKRDGASELDMPAAPLNYILMKIFGLELFLLRLMTLPFGVSVLAVVRK